MATIRKFSPNPRKPLSSTELKEFRFYVSQLKQKGITYRPGRTARPYFVSDGKTLADLVNKNAGKLKPYPKAAPPTGPAKLLPLRRPFEIHDLPGDSKSLAQLLSNLEDNADEINKLKKPDDRFGLQIDGIRSYAIYYDIGQLAKDLGESEGIQQVLRKHQESQELFKALKIVRWNKTTTEWKPRAQKLTAVQKERRAKNAARQAKARKRKK